MDTVDCGREESGKREVMLIFKRDQLLYDIKNCCYVEGHIMVESHDEVRHMVQDVGEEGNVDRVTRMLDVAHADIVERLYPFTKREISKPVYVDLLRDRPVYGIALSVPETFSQTTINLLGELIHELLVCTAVEDWLSTTNPPKAVVWDRKKEALYTRITQIRNTRRGRYRIKPHWL